MSWLIAKAYAQISLIGPGVPCADKFTSGQITADCIPQYIAYLIQQVFALTGALCLIMLIVGGYQWALGSIAGGKDKAKATLLWAITGMILSTLSFFIIDFVISSLAAL